jgi:hypothetical protein
MTTMEAFWQLWAEVLRRKIEEDYGGHEDYHQMLEAVDSDIPIYGCDVTIRKKNPRTGQIYTVSYHLGVYDDMGNPMKGLDDVGGKCAVKGEIIKKGYIFTCEKCGENYCRRHIEFVDQGRDLDRVPLCRYGTMGTSGCHYRYAHEYWPKHRHKERQIEDLQKELEVMQAKTALEHGKADYEESSLRYDEIEIKKLQLKNLKKELKGPGILTKIFGDTLALPGGAPPITCSECGFSPASHKVTCKSCGTRFTVSGNSLMRCPRPDCREVISEIKCFRCGLSIYV